MLGPSDYKSTNGGPFESSFMLSSLQVHLKAVTMAMKTLPKATKVALCKRGLREAVEESQWSELRRWLCIDLSPPEVVENDVAFCSIGDIMHKHSGDDGIGTLFMDCVVECVLLPSVLHASDKKATEDCLSAFQAVHSATSALTTSFPELRCPWKS